MSVLSTFDFKNLTYLKPRKDNSMYVSKILYENQEINIQLKRKVTISGVYRDGNKYYLDLIFDDDNVKDRQFLKLYKQLEMSSIKKIHENYNKWMGVDDKLEWEDVYSSFKTQMTEEENIKKIRFNLITIDNMMDTAFFNQNLEKVSYKDLEEGDEISLIVNFNGIKFGKKNFENLWQVLQVKIYNKQDTEEKEQTKCQIVVSSDDEDVSDAENESESIVDIEDLEKLDMHVLENYKKYKEEESLKIIE